jgi:hypothetical protein
MKAFLKTLSTTQRQILFFAMLNVDVRNNDVCNVDVRNIDVWNIYVCNVDVCNVDVCNVVFAMLIDSGAKLAPFNSGGVCQNCPAKTDDALQGGGGGVSGHKPVKLMVKTIFPYKFLLITLHSIILNLLLPCQSR